MNIDDFNIQAAKLKSTADQFPSLQMIWDKKFLRIYVQTKIDWEICILYSHAFSCPVMYFRPRTLYLDPNSLKDYLKNNNSSISAAELPITGEPFYFLHPCQTNNILPTSNLGAWLSVVLQILDINFPINFYELFNQ